MTTTAAEGLFGRKRLDAMVSAFRELDKDKDGRLSVKEIGFILRSQGLCPSEKQISGFQSEIESEGGFFNKSKFIDIAVRCGRSEHQRANELVDFFSPFDENRTGIIPARVFRNLMENAGEPFKRSQVDEMIKEFSVNENGDIDYRQFLLKISQK